MCAGLSLLGLIEQCLKMLPSGFKTVFFSKKAQPHPGVFYWGGFCVDGWVFGCNTETSSLESLKMQSSVLLIGFKTSK